jgi:hypothetical protein
MLMKGDIAAALGELRAQYDAGADPVVVLTDLAEFTHLVTRLKLVPEALRITALNQAERVRGGDLPGASRSACWPGPGNCCSRALPRSSRPTGR